MNILAIDLASRRYSDFGFIFLESGSRTPVILQPADLGLSDPPSLIHLACSLNNFCARRNVAALLIDGPHAWKDPARKDQHMRLCERVLNTPGKTGTIGQVKPATYLNFTIFSITLFHTLRRQFGWTLLTPHWPEQPEARFLIEAFPTAAWRTLGLPALPSKARTGKDQLELQRLILQQATGYQLPEGMTHDQLQAAVLLPAGEAVVRGAREEILLVGLKPGYTTAGDVLEGYIAVPVRPGS